MNNRIMAMLFALVAAMFISIVPVKAEAAVAAHEHKDENGNCVCDVKGCTEKMHVANGVWEYDEDGHYQWCANNCGTKVLEEEHELGQYENHGASQHWRRCKTCDYIEKVSHNLEWTSTSEGHKQACKECSYVPVQMTAHTYGTAKDNEDGKTHSKTCTVEGCGYVLTADHVDDEKTGNCVCNDCGAELEHKLGDWVKDIDGHKKVCQKTNCNAVEYEDEHDYGAAQAVEGHTYHVKVCQTCGFERQFNCTSTKDNDCLCDECGTLVKHTTSDMEYVAGVEATCEEEGNIGYNKCKTCGRPFSVNGDKCTLYTEKVTIDATGHEFKEGRNWHENADGTGHYKVCGNDGCDEHVYITAEGVKVGEEAHTHGSWYNNGAGQHCEVCAVCGLSYGDEDHEYKTPVQTTVLNGEGKQQHGLECECGAVFYRLCTFNDECVCTVCGTAKIHTDKSNMTYVAAKAPTCTEDGHTDYYECKDCGGTFLSTGAEWDPFRAKLGHDWEARPDTIAGEHLQKCKRVGCNAYRTLGHEDTNDDCLCDVNNCGKLVHSHKLVFHRRVEADCVTAGTEGYYTYAECDKKMFDVDMNEITAPVVIPATNHPNVSDWMPGEDGMHVKVCEDCEEIVESAPHSFVARSVTCSVCGAEEGLTHVAAKAANCTESGNVEYWYSKITGKMYADEAGTRQLTSVTVAATGHNMSGWQDTGDYRNHEQVCQNTGCNHKLTEAHTSSNGCFCTECEGSLGSGHTLTMVNMVPASCEQAGTEAHYKCSCNKLYDLDRNPISAPKTIAKLKHDMNTKVKEDAKEGKHYIECKNCDYRLYENHGMVLSDPNKGNYHQWLCDCGKLEIETHYDKNGDNKCDVCDHNLSGSSTDKVEQHDSKTVYTGQKDTVTATKNWWWNWQEWFTPSNSGGSGATGNTEQNTTSSTGTSGNSSSNNNATTNGGTANNNATTNNGGASSNGGASNNGGTTSTPSVTTPAASQTNVIAQFITWFLGLFGF